MKQMSIRELSKNEEDWMIDDTENIENQAIYIWSGLLDDVCHPKGQRATKDLYEYYDTEKLTFKVCPDCYHGWEDDCCEEDEKDYQIGFKTIYEQLGYITEWADDATDEELESLGTLQSFSQREFVQTGWAWNSVNDDGEDWTWEETEFMEEGLVYIPNNC